MGNNEYKARHKEQGLCVDCSQPAAPGRIRCWTHAKSLCKSATNWYKAHREEQLVYSKIKREQYEKNFRCKRCSTPLWEDEIKAGLKTCSNCRHGFYRDIYFK